MSEGTNVEKDNAGASLLSFTFSVNLKRSDQPGCVSHVDVLQIHSNKLTFPFLTRVQPEKHCYM